MKHTKEDNRKEDFSMDRRNKVWLILLALLLVAAVAAVVVINNRLNNSEELLQAANVRLAGVQEQNETLTADIESVSGELAAAQENGAALEAQLTEAQENSATLEARLTAEEENSASLEAQLTEAQENSASLEAELTSAQENSASLEAQLTAAQENSATLEAELTAAQESSASLEAQLAAAQENSATLEAQLTEAQEAARAAQADAADAAQTGKYSVYTADEAVEAISARSAELESTAAEAQAHVANLSKLLAAAESGITELTGEPVAEPEAEDAPDETSASALMMVPEVYIPEALKAASELDAPAIQSRIDEILAADEGEMTDEEKVAALEDIRAEVGGHVTGLNDALASISQQQMLLAASQDGASAIQAELASAQQNVDNLDSAIAEGTATIAELEAQVAALSGQSETDSAQIEELKALIETERASMEQMNLELIAARTERDGYLAALEAYRIAHNPSAGEAHAASTLGNRIAVAADGTSATWRYANTIASGNTVVLHIELNGEEIYRSEPLAPGAQLQSFQFSRALTAGQYEAFAVTSVRDADGNTVSSTRVPVMIVVE